MCDWIWFPFTYLSEMRDGYSRFNWLSLNRLSLFCSGGWDWSSRHWYLKCARTLVQVPFPVGPCRCLVELDTPIYWTSLLCAVHPWPLRLIFRYLSDFRFVDMAMVIFPTLNKTACATSVLSVTYVWRCIVSTTFVMRLCGSWNVETLKRRNWHEVPNWCIDLMFRRYQSIWID